MAAHLLNGRGNKALPAAQQGNAPDVMLVDNPVVSTLVEAGILRPGRREHPRRQPCLPAQAEHLRADGSWRIRMPDW
ncbi:hypothetical protein ABB07_01285 [Streptomyces incarnatus]|uniref:Uncharacterized protein n=1 Tax=Streptomyces incarnatus TaxID=665007 RepID=A0ABM5TCM6_9ACTN|nr:hypothetical protein [Streptomyces incarnatus]AKJ08719.1 hypothetical protein ABB07_01285 [Streptomyces incarnatus]